MQGRFTSPDEFKGGPDELFDFEDDASSNPTFYVELEIPQSLNKYQYSYNNPYKYNDPTGHCIGALAPAAPWCIRGSIEVTKVLAPVIGGAIAAAGAVLIDIITSTPNTAGDPACPACNSSQRMGQSLMANSKSSGNVKAKTGAKAVDAKVSSTPPNPNEKNGGPKHQKKVKEAEKEVRQKDCEHKENIW